MTDSGRLLSPEEDAGRRAAALDTILRAYAPRELELAREAIAAHPDDKTSAINAVWVALGDMRKVRDLVDAVAEADGAYEHARPAPTSTPTTPFEHVPCGTCGAPSTHFARDMYTIYDPTSTVDRYQPGEMKAGCDAHPVESRTIDAPLVPARRVLGRGLAELGQETEQAARQSGAGTGTGTIQGTPTGFENVLLPEKPTVMGKRAWTELEKGVTKEVSSAARERDKRDLFAFRYGATIPPGSGANFFLQAQNTPPMGPDQVYATTAASSLLSLPLQQATQRAVDEFLGTGTHRTQALRGFLRFLTQEDLATVLAECCTCLDDEHLSQSVRMMGPDDLQSLNFATADEVSTRMLDAGVGAASGFPIRPLEPHEEREPVDFSENGNPILEKDIVQAIGYIETYPRSTPDEAALAARLERLEGWNGVYASEVAREAWARYYRDEEPK